MCLQAHGRGMKFRRPAPTAPSTQHPDAAKPWYRTGKDIPSQFHGGPVTVRKVNFSKLGSNEGSDSGDFGKGFYTTPSLKTARDYRDSYSAPANVRYTVPPAISDDEGHPHTMISTFKVHPSAHILHFHTWVKHNIKGYKAYDEDRIERTVKRAHTYARKNGYDAIDSSHMGSVRNDDAQMVWLHDKTPKLVPVPHRVARRQGLKNRDESLNLRFKPLEERSAEPAHPDAGKPWYKSGKKFPTVFHGGPVTVRKIDPSKAGDNEGSIFGDFGPGFYTTTDVHSARGYKDTSIDSKNVRYRRKPNPAKKRTNRYSPLLNKDGEPHTMLSAFKAHPSAHVLDLHKYIQHNGGWDKTELGNTDYKSRRNTIQRAHDYAHANGYDAVYAKGAGEPDQIAWLKPTHKLVPVPHRVARRQGLKRKDEAMNFRFRPLAEHVITMLPHHTELRKKHVGEIHAMLTKSYEKVGGIAGSGLETPEAMSRSIPLIKAVRKNGKIVAASLYKDKAGRKAVASATDSTELGKQGLNRIKDDDFKMKRSWAEQSGPMLSFVRKTVDIRPHLIHPKDVQGLMPDDQIHYPVPADDPEVQRHPDLADHFYRRVIGGKMHTKIAFGHPSLGINTKALGVIKNPLGEHSILSLRFKSLP